MKLCYRFYMDYNYGFDTIDVSDVQLLKGIARLCFHLSHVEINHSAEVM